MSGPGGPQQPGAAAKCACACNPLRMRRMRPPYARMGGWGTCAWYRCRSMHPQAGCGHHAAHSSSCMCRRACARLQQHRLCVRRMNSTLSRPAACTPRLAVIIARLIAAMGWGRIEPLTWQVCENSNQDACAAGAPRCVCMHGGAWGRMGPACASAPAWEAAWRVHAADSGSGALNACAAAASARS